MHANPQKAGSVLSGIPRSGQCRPGKSGASLRRSKVCHSESPERTKFPGNCSSTSPFNLIKMTNAPDGMNPKSKGKSGPATTCILFRATTRCSKFFRKKGKSLSSVTLSEAYGHSPFEPSGKRAASNPPGFADKRRSPREKPIVCPLQSEPSAGSSRLAVPHWMNWSLSRQQGHDRHFFAIKGGMDGQPIQHPKSTNPLNMNAQSPDEIWRN